MIECIFANVCAHSDRRSAPRSVFATTTSCFSLTDLVLGLEASSAAVEDAESPREAAAASAE